MTKTNLFLLLFALLLGTSCNEKRRLLSDGAFRTEVEKDFEAKKAALPDGELFAVFDLPLTDEERNALMFLYAYMPLGDITDYDGELYIESVRSTFRARSEMPWGDSIPEDIFLHFVLPVRVNNETLDSSRTVFYEELKDRVKGLSLYDAVLEVNHWCHEKVIYTPSDARTSSPLATVSSAYGRCGEESTFTVAALRSVGIPARQVYTPRWAHTDDNHAWVEAWVNGKWYFLGACEPEPVLNLGWFNGPAYRGMLMHTKVFGKYRGPEEIMDTTACYTEINVTGNYAPTARTTVTVVDAGGNPVSGANVEFKIYNYAEFYTVASKTTDTVGQVSLTAGKGDMLVWVSKEGRFGYGKVSFGKDADVTVILDKRPGDTGSIDLDIVPPADGAIPAEVTEEQKTANALRLHREDSIRNAYVESFFTKEEARKFAEQAGIITEKAACYITKSRGNRHSICTFLTTAGKEKMPLAIDLLGVISEKDLRDTPAGVLFDHLNNTKPLQSSLFTRYVLNPRVADEMLTPYRGLFQKEFDLGLAEKAKTDPQLLVDWVRQNIRINDSLNPQRIPMMPVGVWRGRVADKSSRDIFFVALCRSLGIPARIEQVTGRVQYAAKGLRWTDVNFEAASPSDVARGSLTASYLPVKSLDDPKYYSHFTISKIRPDGRLRTLDFASGNTDMGGGDTWSTLFRHPFPVDTGHYLLVTGTRMASGSVLAKLTFFNIEKGKTTPICLEMRESKDGVQVIGNFNSEGKFKRADTGETVSLLATTGRGYYVVALLGARQEPTNHAMRDIAAVADGLEQWGRGIVLLFPDEKSYRSFDPKEFGALPTTVTYGIDADHTIQSEMVSGMKLRSDGSLPIFLIADTFNRVVFVSQGYTIGLGERLMQVIHKL